MDADRINAQAHSGNPAEASTEANAEQPQSRRMAKMLRALEVCFAENIRAELVERHDHADEETITATMRRRYSLSDALLDHFYEAARKMGAIERSPRADGITLSAADGYEPITRPISRNPLPVEDRGDYPAAYSSQRPNGNPVLLFPESTRPASLCYDPQPTIRTAEHTDKSKQRKDEVDEWREDHSQHRRDNLRIIARTADWNRQPTDFHADPLADLREKIEAQIASGQARKNAERAEQRAARKRQGNKRNIRDFPDEGDGYVIPGCGFSAEASADDEGDDPEQGFVPAVLNEMEAASYAEAWDM